MHQKELQTAGELSTNLIGETPMCKRKNVRKDATDTDA